MDVTGQERARDPLNEFPAHRVRRSAGGDRKGTLQKVPIVEDQ